MAYIDNPIIRTDATNKLCNNAASIMKPMSTKFLEKGGLQILHYAVYLEYINSEERLKYSYL